MIDRCPPKIPFRRRRAGKGNSKLAACLLHINNSGVSSNYVDPITKTDSICCRGDCPKSRSAFRSVALARGRFLLYSNQNDGHRLRRRAYQFAPTFSQKKKINLLRPTDRPTNRRTHAWSCSLQFGKNRAEQPLETMAIKQPFDWEFCVNPQTGPGSGNFSEFIHCVRRDRDVLRLPTMGRNLD